MKDTIYYLTKELIHHTVDEEVPTKETSNFTVLDVNCGTGNDFPFFIDRRWKVVGCDGSAGMLNKAYETYVNYVDSGQIHLYQGLLESIAEKDFDEQKFDLIFSVTGGFSYVNDTQLHHINQVLSKLLKPNGKIVLAHLNRFCLPEFLYRIYHLKNPFLRLKKSIRVKIKGNEEIMYLRSPSQLRKLYSPYFKNIALKPLLAITPPYQTGFKPSLKALNKLKRIELKWINSSKLVYVADQVVVVGSAK